MAATIFLYLLMQSLIQYPKMVGDGLDENTHLRMELRARLLEREMARLLQEVEQGTQEHSVRAWGAQLWAALQHWHCWAPAAVLLLLLGLWYSLKRRRSRAPENGGEEGGGEENDDGHEGENNAVNVQHNDNDDGHEGEDNAMNVQEDNDDGNEGENEVVILQEDNNNDGNEDRNVGEEEEAGNAAANAENNNDDRNEVEEEQNDFDMGGIFEERIQWPVQNLEIGCERTTDLMDNFILIFQHVLSNTFYPLPQRAIGVGSAFEGWSPREEDIVYRVLVPLIPPPGHTFHLEMDTSGQIPGRNFSIRVELVCTCTGEQQGESTQCFLHQPEEQQRGNEEPTFLNTLCTGSYLDVEKTAHWFYQLVRASWMALPQSHTWHLVLLPSSRSCKFKLTKGRENLTVEILPGVQQGNSDIFVSSQHTESLFTPSTMWPETYAVAEMRFFRYITSQAPGDSWHLRCLQLLVRALLGIDFTTYTLKTIVMHLLNTIPVSGWHRRHFVQRIGDAMQYLRCCLLEKRLDHFIVGNQNVYEVIKLPPDVQNAEPPNLFHHLAQDPAAHTQAMSECRELEDRIERIMFSGH